MPHAAGPDEERADGLPAHDGGVVLVVLVQDALVNLHVLVGHHVPANVNILFSDCIIKIILCTDTEVHLLLSILPKQLAPIN